MKLEGDRLQQRLQQQRETIDLVGADGIRHHGISARYVADTIAGKAFIGYGKNGVVECVKAIDAPRQGPFATRRAVEAITWNFRSPLNEINRMVERYGDAEVQRALRAIDHRPLHRKPPKKRLEREIRCYGADGKRCPSLTEHECRVLESAGVGRVMRTRKGIVVEFGFQG